MDAIETLNKVVPEVQLESPSTDLHNNLGLDGKEGLEATVEAKPAVKYIEVDTIVNSADFRLVSYQQGETYVGEVNAAERKHGVGMLRNQNGTKIIGSFLDGVLHGPCLIETNNLQFIGEAAANVFHGVGMLQISGDAPFRYVGQFKRGSLTGYGQMTFADGSAGIPYHEGLFDNGQLKTIQQVKKFVLEVERSTARLEQWLRAIGAAALRKEAEIKGNPIDSAAAAADYAEFYLDLSQSEPSIDGEKLPQNDGYESVARNEAASLRSAQESSQVSLELPSRRTIVVEALVETVRVESDTDRVSSSVSLRSMPGTISIAEAAEVQSTDVARRTETATVDDKVIVLDEEYL